MNYDATRVKQTIACRDCDDVPKVEGAGEFVGENNEYQRMHNGTLVMRGSYHGSWMSEIISELQGHHEPQEEKAFAEVLKYVESGSTMVELGCYWAYYSLWFHQQVPDARNIMIEPNEDKLEVGHQHFSLNNYQGKFIHGFIGGESIPEATFIDWDGRETRASQISVDGLMDELGLEAIEILHSDIQGAELAMLEGAARALKHQKIRFLFISTHGHQHRRCLRLLNRHKYQILASHTVLESCSGDGLIVAMAPGSVGPGPISVTKRQVSAVELIRYELSHIKQLLLAFFRAS